MTAEQERLLAAWYYAKREAEAAQPAIAREQKARAALIGAFDLSDGTSNIDLGGGYTLKASIGVTTSVDEPLLMSLRSRLQDVGVALESFTRSKISLDTKAYKRLPAHAIAIVNEAITTKPSAPTVEILKEGKPC